MSIIRRKIFNIYRNSDAAKKVVDFFAGIVPHSYLYGNSFKETYAFIKKTEFEPEDYWKNYSAQQLQKLYQYVFDKVPYYHQVMVKSGIKYSNEITPENVLDLLREFPMLNKESIRNNFESLRSTDNNIPSDYVSTGGTSGEPFYFYINSDRSSKEWAYIVDQWSRAGFSLNSRRATFRGLKTESLFEDDVVFNERRFSSFKISEDYLKKIWPHLLTYNPDYLYGYPSAIYLISRLVEKMKLEKPESLKGILIGSEDVYDSQREYIERVFGVKTFAWYGHSEKLVLAGECEHDKTYHAYPQYGYAEFITKDGNPAKPGELAEIVGTGYMNTVMPFIRYKTNDWCIYLGDRCGKCGRNYHIFNNIKGRWSQEMLVGKDNNLISMSAINIHSREMEKVFRFQFYQDTPGEALLKLVPLNGFNNEDKENINKVFSEKIKDTMNLSTVVVNEIPLTISGKYKFIDQKLDLQDYLN